MAQSITDSVPEKCASTPPVIKKVNVPSWSDEQPSAYFAKYEQVLTANGEPKTKWATFSLSIYPVRYRLANVTPDLMDSYDSAKEIGSNG